MTIINPIADMFTRIRNAILIKSNSVEIPHSNMKTSICEILYKEGFIGDFLTINDDLVKKKIKVKIKYDKNGNSVINELKVISKPSKRIYLKKCDIPKPLNGYGLVILSTSDGILTGKEARLANKGGELLAEVN